MIKMQNQALLLKLNKKELEQIVWFIRLLVLGNYEYKIRHNRIGLGLCRITLARLFAEAIVILISIKKNYKRSKRTKGARKRIKTPTFCHLGDP
jgi:hypothetical protein